MYHVSAQGVNQCMINVHYYYYYKEVQLVCKSHIVCLSDFMAIWVYHVFGFYQDDTLWTTSALNSLDPVLSCQCTSIDGN